MIIGSLVLPSIGGGVCQTATTLFNDAFELGPADPRAHEPQPLPLALPARARRDRLVGRPRLQVPERPEARAPDQDVVHRLDADVHVLRHERAPPRRREDEPADEVDGAVDELRDRPERAARLGEGRRGHGRAGLRRDRQPEGLRRAREAAAARTRSGRTTSRTARRRSTARGRTPPGPYIVLPSHLDLDLQGRFNAVTGGCTRIAPFDPEPRRSPIRTGRGDHSVWCRPVARGNSIIDSSTTTRTASSGSSVTCSSARSPGEIIPSASSSPLDPVDHLAPVVGVEEHDREVADLARLDQHERLVQLVERPEAAREDHESLRRADEADLARVEVVEGVRDVEVRVRPLLVRQDDVEADRQPAAFLARRGWPPPSRRGRRR